MEEDDLCPICLDDPADTQLECTHLFCRNCILTLQQEIKSFCPLCRAPLIIDLEKDKKMVTISTSGDVGKGPRRCEGILISGVSKGKQCQYKTWDSSKAFCRRHDPDLRNARHLKKRLEAEIKLQYCVPNEPHEQISQSTKAKQEDNWVDAEHPPVSISEETKHTQAKSNQSVKQEPVSKPIEGKEKIGTEIVQNNNNNNNNNNTSFVARSNLKMKRRNDGNCCIL